MAKVAAQSYSPRQIELINHAVSHNIDLLTLRSSAEWRDATKEHDAFIASQRKDFKAHDYLAHGNHGPFQSEQEKNAAYSHPLYATSEEYRIAVMHKTAQTPNSIMGLVVPKDPLSPEALMRAAQEDHYHAVRQDLFDKAGSKDQVVATRARLDILNLAQDPAYQEVMQAFERTEAETKPYETWLKSQKGGVQIQTFPQGTEAEMQAECDRRNLEAYNARPGGVGDGGVSGEPNMSIG